MNTIPESAVIITIIPCPQMNSANINPEEIQISSLNVPLFIEVVIAKICPRVCSALKTENAPVIQESLIGRFVSGSPSRKDPSPTLPPLDLSVEQRVGQIYLGSLACSSHIYNSGTAPNYRYWCPSVNNFKLLAQIRHN